MTTVFYLIQNGGPFIWILLVLFMIVLIITFERFIFYRSFYQRLDLEIPAWKAWKAKKNKGKKKNGFAADQNGTATDYIHHVLPRLEKYTPILASFSTISPYLGLLGTLGGIIRTFMSMTETSDLINQGLAASLIATGGGLLIAILSTVSYNYCQHQINTLLRKIQNWFADNVEA